MATLQSIPADYGSLEGDADKIGGFSLHAGVAAEAHGGQKLKAPVPLHRASSNLGKAPIALAAG